MVPNTIRGFELIWFLFFLLVVVGMIKLVEIWYMYVNEKAMSNEQNGEDQPSLEKARCIHSF